MAPQPHVKTEGRGSGEHRTLGTTLPPALVLGSTLSPSSLASHFSVFAVSLSGLLVFPQGSLPFTHHQRSPLHQRESTGHDLVHIGLTTDTRRPTTTTLTGTEQAAILPSTGSVRCHCHMKDKTSCWRRKGKNVFTEMATAQQDQIKGGTQEYF